MVVLVFALWSPLSVASADRPESDPSASAMAPASPPAVEESTAVGQTDSTPAHPPPTAVPVATQFIGDGAAFLPQRRGIQLDFQIEGGAGLALRGELDYTLFGRARLGMLIVREPIVFAFGGTFELGGTIGIGVGGQLDFIHLASGWSLNLGGAYSLQDRAAAVSASIGYAILGIEWQHHFSDRDSDAIFFKVRIPVGVFLFLLNHR